MAIFDIDMTILDNTQRFKDARRGGLVDKEGKAKRKSKLELPGKAYKRRNEFLYSPDNLAKDRVIPGALALVEELARSGVVIAYVTARPSQFYDVTYNQLEKKGFPLFKSQTDEVLLFLKSGGAGTANFKRLTFEKLNAQYDVRMVFDDRADVLVGATSVGIPGVYQSVNDYNKFRKKSESVASNPSLGDDSAEQERYTPLDWLDRDNWEELEPEWMMKIDYEGVQGEIGNKSEIKNMTIFEIDDALRIMEHDMKTITERMESERKKAWGKGAYAWEIYDMYEEYQKDLTESIEAIVDELKSRKGGVMPNPPVKPRRKKMKNGKYRKEPAKKYVERFMANDKMAAEFPDRGQRYAVCLRYVEKFYGKSGLKSVGARPNPEKMTGAQYRAGVKKMLESREKGITRSEMMEPVWKMKVRNILVKEGGASGIDPLMKAFPKGTTKKKARKLLTKVHDVYQHEAGDYILRNPEEYSEDYMVPRDIHRLGKAASRLDGNYEEGQDVPEWWKSKLSVTSKDADTLADSLEYVVDSDIDENPPVDAKLLPIMRDSPTGQYKNLGSVFAEVYIGRSIFKDVGEGIQSIYKGLVGGRTTMTERRMAMAVATMQKELSDRAKALGGNAVANLELDYEIPEAAASVTIIASADAVKMRSPPKANPARKNPANPGKVEKGKKLYKHMNGKDVERVETAKVDMGDVWYQVGEGGCWQIGYMSGKETGSSEQKYTHTFNEESKDGNFPKLYATIPDKGKPMLIIKGGSWKIKTDENGVAWIYD